VRTLRLEPVARTLFYAANVGKLIIRQRSVPLFLLAAACLVVYFCWHTALFLRLAAGFGIIGLRIFSTTRYTDRTARMDAYFARKEAKLNAITEARLRKEPWRRPRPALSIPEEHVGRYFGHFPGAQPPHVLGPLSDQPCRAGSPTTFR
jgi:hypothetical protein